MTDLFQNVNGKLVPRKGGNVCYDPLCEIHNKPRDVCARKHGGNEQSKAAFRHVVDGLNLKQLVVLNAIKALDSMQIYGYGATVDELSEMFDRPPNAISGRITELRIKGKIEKRGTRKTRSGCSAAVWVAI